jgi:hypothetical protein
MGLAFGFDADAGRSRQRRKASRATNWSARWNGPGLASGVRRRRRPFEGMANGEPSRQLISRVEIGLASRSALNADAALRDDAASNAHRSKSLGGRRWTRTTGWPRRPRRSRINGS